MTTNKDLEIAQSLLDIESLGGLRKLFKSVVKRCYELASNYNSLNQSQKEEINNLRNMQRELVKVMSLAPENMIRAAREAA